MIELHQIGFQIQRRSNRYAGKTMTSRYQAYVRPLGSITTMIRVAGIDNAKWLRGTLLNKGVNCTEPVELRGSTFFTFRALHVNQIDHDKLLTIMEQIPEIELMFDPA